MRIKGLTLIGFKSFPERTSLSFEPGISAVVGPNGCGKSNLVDAVRWVLGEQSAKLLRGRSMEDLIFKGSESRKVLGLAEVALTLTDAEELTSPLVSGRPEVMVSRCLYRSGESEYAINKVPCRLKDITDLFLDQGVSSRVYSIIEQGQINQILTGKGEERRGLIEEAAGVSKYRERKRETLLKLEGTRQNLARIDDVIGEVKRQMNSLKRQASAAERYQRLKEEIRSLEIELAWQKFTRLKQQASANQKEIETIQGQLQALLAQVKEKEVGMEKVRASLLQKEKAKRQAEERAAAAKARAQQLEALTLSLNREAELNKRQLGKIEEENLGIKAALEQMTGEAEELRQVGTELKESALDIQRKIAESEALLLTVRGQHREEVQKLEQAKVEVFDLHRRLAEVTTHLKTCQAEIEQGKSKKEKNRQETTSVLKMLERVQGERHELASKLRSLQEEIALKQRLKEEKEFQLARAVSRLTQKKEQAQELKREWDTFSLRLASLKEMEETLEGYRTPVRSLLLATKKEPASIPGIRGTVADLITVEEKYERALVSALGERLQYVIVDDLSSALALLPIREGRVGFIGRDIQAPAESEPVPAGENVLGHLCELVAAPADCYQAVKYLLWPWFLVSDLATALKLRQQGFDSVNFVTLEGEVLERGSILITAPGVGPDAAVLARKREIRELEQKVGPKEIELSGLLAEVVALENETQAQRVELEKIQEATSRHQGEITSLQQQLRWQEQEEARAGESLQLLASEREEADKEMAGALVAQEEAARVKIELDRAKEAKESELENLRSSEETLRVKTENLSQELSRLKVEAASLEERLQGINLRRAKLEESAQHQQAVLGKKEGEYNEIQNELDRIGAELTAVEQEQGGPSLGGEQAEAEVNQAGREYEQTAAAFDQAQASLKGLERAFSETREELRDKELAAAQIRLELNHTQDLVRETYGLDLKQERPSAEGMALLEEEAIARLQQLKEEVGKIGQVNLLALEEYHGLRERFELLARERRDLSESMDSLEQAIRESDRVCREKFQETFILANQKFNEVFRRLFQGGRAQLALTGEEDPLECGVEMMVEPPGKRLQNALLLSTGEKALTAIALIFALFLIKPSPFCFLDEIDAPLDDANIARLNSLVKEIAGVSQLIIITHNKKTMEAADTLYGITMEEAGVSKLVSVKLN